MNDEFTQRLAKIECALHSAFLPDMPNAASELNPIALLSAPCASLVAGGGKRWRPLLAVLAYQLAGGSGEEIYTLTPLIEGIHTASLIHDDIEDNSELRRGQPAAHVAYGLDSALNSGSWLYFQALGSLEAYRAPANIKLDLYAAALTHIRALHEGQALDIHWHRTAGFFPSRKDYERMIRLKTGALAALAAYTGMRAAGKAHEESAAFASLFEAAGVGFQILDDAKNISAGNAGKKRGDDIVEGKKSLPVILHIEKHPEDAAALTAYFEQAQREGIESPAVEKAIALLSASGSIADAETQGRGAVHSVLERLDVRYGRTAKNMFEKLFNLMQGR
ncbi:polyprenyl synthetase family protein [Treponema vincentii]|uniref:polyprenyl synthetase family protein n=1 Tax=Treponema vincentii TaxID=69710 RepID=UPI0020A4B171|nr:polyprenyl synthetase family protein [Treponema vincentii]UTC48528.1 polyprenyl synthetase family protein [Treponema vincentii]UTC59191.1 polyprenyl synthetase family protein [Treponema vincentii]